MTAQEIEHVKDLLPTSLGSEEIRERIAADVLRRSVFSARMASAPYLALVRDVCERILSGEINDAEARDRLGSALEQMGHSPLEGGGMANPASIRRLQLIVDTQRQMAASAAVLSEQTASTVALWPAWELTRLESRRAPREDWPARWRMAGDAVAWEGALKDRFIALKSSPIWQALGDGAGGFRDTLRNPFPPFAYNSGMDWVEVDRDECARLGLSPDDAEVPASPSLSPGEADLADAVARWGFPEIAEGLA